MYSTCIFCSAGLGSNQMIEEFPVGRSLAFDAWKGRLWAVCGKCGRWNLAPIEERWEATESADKLFADSRLRVHSENIGLARLPDGTRLIRVGEALPGELAAWRYGDQLTRRRQRYLLGTAGVTGLLLVGFGGLAAAGAMGAVSLLFNSGQLFWQRRQARQVVHRLPAAHSPTGEELVIRRVHFNGARIVAGTDQSLALQLPFGLRGQPGGHEPLIVEGAQAEAVLGRVMVTRNAKGARQGDVARAVGLLETRGLGDFLGSMLRRAPRLGLPQVPEWGRPMGFSGRRVRRFGDNIVSSFRGEPVPYQKVAASEVFEVRGFGPRPKGAQLTTPEALALEMALHEESERRALGGELRVLEAAWREAEEIAAIADALPDDPLDRLRR